MKRTFSRVAIVVAAVFVISLAYIAGLHAQQSPTTPTKPPATTNWIGYLVVGRNDTVDAIAIGGPHPTVDPKVEIGLRSDGVLVWRRQ